MVTKEETIERWMDIAAAVFRAEDEISAEWFPKLRKAKKMEDKERRSQLAMDYLRALATEIVENSDMKFEDE